MQENDDTLTDRLLAVLPFCATLGVLFGVHSLLYPGRAAPVLTPGIDLLVLLGGGTALLVIDFWRRRAALAAVRRAAVDADQQA